MLKSPGYSLQVSIGILTWSDTATPPIPCNPREISRGLHEIGWAGPPSHLSGAGFFGQAIEPLRRPFFRELACAFCVSLGWRAQATLPDTFTLLLMIDLTRSRGAQASPTSPRYLPPYIASGTTALPDRSDQRPSSRALPCPLSSQQTYASRSRSCRRRHGPCRSTQHLRPGIDMDGDAVLRYVLWHTFSHVDATLREFSAGMYVVLFFSSAFALARSRKKLTHGWVIRTTLCLM